MITVNGENIENIAGKTIGAFLVENDYDMGRIAVEVNEEIIPKSQYESTLLQDGDCIEVVSFVGGG